ncbi:unnamed protein product [Closterium sp. NIES-53]
MPPHDPGKGASHMEREKMDGLHLTDQHWEILEALKAVLSPFNKVSKAAEGTAYPTVSMGCARILPYSRACPLPRAVALHARMPCPARAREPCPMRLPYPCCCPTRATAVPSAPALPARDCPALRCCLAKPQLPLAPAVTAANRCRCCCRPLPLLLPAAATTTLPARAASAALPCLDAASTSLPAALPCLAAASTSLLAALPCLAAAGPALHAAQHCPPPRPFLERPPACLSP